MVNLDLIEETLDELMNDGPTDFKTCEYIAHLTITKEVLLGKIGKPVELEKLISDFGNYSTSGSTDSFMDLCENIKNFVRLLYRNSESTNDKNILRNTLNQIEKEVLNNGNDL